MSSFPPDKISTEKAHHLVDVCDPLEKQFASRLLRPVHDEIAELGRLAVLLVFARLGLHGVDMLGATEAHELGECLRIAETNLM